MIYPMTRLKVADNSGARMAMCIGMIGQKKVARIGTLAVVTIKQIGPNSKVKRGTVQRGVIVRQRKEYSRPDGRSIKFDDNAIVLLGADLKSLIGSRVFGPVAAELRSKWMKIVSVAEQVV